MLGISSSFRSLFIRESSTHFFGFMQGISSIINSEEGAKCKQKSDCELAPYL